VAHPREADIVALLEALNRSGVEYLVVGGAAAVLHGAGVTTYDLDIVPRRTDENADRLLSTLETLDVHIIEPMNRGLKPRASDFLGRGQMNLSTSVGPIDVLCVLHDGRGFDELEEHTIVLKGDLPVRLLDLPTLIEVKSSIGRAKDRLTVPLLLALLERQDSEDGPN
jgi:hypothetical protein